MLDKNNAIFYKLLLLTATIIWGSSFFILKNSLDDYPLFLLLAMRFLVSGVILTLIFGKTIIKSDEKTILGGFIAGIIVAVAYTVQTYGLNISNSASKNAFLTASYVILVPFMSWLFLKKKPDKYNIISAIICIIGIALVSLNGDLSVNYGDLLSLSSGIFFGLQIIVISKFVQDKNAISLLSIQLLTAGFIFGAVSLIAEIKEYATINFTINSVLPVVYLMLFATVFAQLFQIAGQKKVQPSQASLILSLEAVFGVLFSVFIDGEKLTAKLIIGFILIFISIIISETKLGFLRTKEKK